LSRTDRVESYFHAVEQVGELRVETFLQAVEKAGQG